MWPPDVSNRLPPNLLLNFAPSTPSTTLSFVVPTAKPRLVSVSIKAAGEAPFSVGGTSRKAVDYVLRVELGGLAGMIAPSSASSLRIITSGSCRALPPHSFAKRVSYMRAALSGASNRSALGYYIKFWILKSELEQSSTLAVTPIRIVAASDGLLPNFNTGNRKSEVTTTTQILSGCA
jgi:hypothetical protein